MVNITTYSDGASRGNGFANSKCSIGGIIYDSEGNTLAELSMRLPDGCTNNQAEYHSLIETLKLVKGMHGVKSITSMMDSNLVVQQVNGKWKINLDSLRILRKEVIALVKQIGVPFELKYVPREHNSVADALANKAFKGE